MHVHSLSPSTQQMLEEMRRNMLQKNKRQEEGEVSPHAVKEQQKNDPESLRTALFEGRAVNVQRIEPPMVSNPAINDSVESDPHRLFQLLRRKKKAFPQASGNSPMKATVPKNSVHRNSVGGGTAGVAGPGHHALHHSHGEHPSAGMGVDGVGIGGGGGGANSNAPGHPWGGPPTEERKEMSARETIRQRQVNSARPAGPSKRPASGMRDRSAVHSATVSSSNTIDGRPATRQKHPKMALDLFPKTQAQGEVFPPKMPRKSASAQNLLVSHQFGGSPSQSLLKVQQQQGGPEKQVLGSISGNGQLNQKGAAGGGGGGGSRPGSGANSTSNRGGAGEGATNVNFNCLFFNSDEELDGHEEFPAARAQVEIPLIETDWFTTGEFEMLPTTDGEEQLRDEEGLDDSDISPRYAESLYEMLKNQKSRRNSSTF